MLEQPGYVPAQRGRQTAELLCPKIMVGRVIGKNGETIKALQVFTGALIQIDQSVEPTRVTVSGNTQSLSLALSMISDVCKGTFKGFALLRQMTQQQRGPGAPHPAMLQSRPVYAPGYGLIPPSQLYGGDIQPSMPMLPRPEAVQLPAGFQYVSSAMGGASQPPVIMQQGGMSSMGGSTGMPDQGVLNAGQQHMAGLSSVYGAVPMSNAMNSGMPSYNNTQQLAYAYQSKMNDMQGPRSSQQSASTLDQRQQQQQQQQQHDMFQYVDQSRPMQLPANVPAVQSIYQDSESSQSSMTMPRPTNLGAAASIFAQQDSTSMPLPGIREAGALYQQDNSIPLPQMYQHALAGTGGGLFSEADPGNGSHSTPLPQLGMGGPRIGNVPQPPSTLGERITGGSGGSSSAKLMQVLAQPHHSKGFSEGERPTISSQEPPGSQSNSAPLPRMTMTKNPTNTTAVSDLLGAPIQTTQAGSPNPSAPLGTLPGTQQKHLVQVIDAEGQASYHFIDTT